MQTVAIAALLGLARLAFPVILSAAEPEPVFVQLERTNPTYRQEDAFRSGRQGAFTTSKLSVSESGEVIYEPAMHVYCQGDYVRPFDLHWTEPAEKRNLFRSVLSAGELRLLNVFLNRPEVKELRDFMNSGPGVGDFEIVIRRAGGSQRIGVRSLAPAHTEFSHDSALLELICRAKEIARRSSGSGEIAAWCRGLLPQ